MSPYHQTKHGQIILGDSLAYMAGVKAESVDLIVTSPPFGLVRKKDYGNVESHEYVHWFKPLPFSEQSY
jgi:DNA modification methylase